MEGNTFFFLAEILNIIKKIPGNAIRNDLRRKLARFRNANK